MRFRVRHITRYKYASRVSHCYNLANVIPRDTDRQRCLKNRITVSPQPAITHKRSQILPKNKCGVGTGMKTVKRTVVDPARCYDKRDSFGPKTISKYVFCCRRYHGDLRERVVQS